MKAVMSMTLDTIWGNQVILSVETELDNAHELTTGEMARMQVWTLSVMAAEVRRKNEATLEIRDEQDDAPPLVGHLGRERQRFDEMNELEQTEAAERESERRVRERERT